MRINLGCGPHTRTGYENLDLYINGPGIAHCDVRRLPYLNDSAEEILAEDVIEHFSRLEWKTVLAEWIRVLAPGGTITLQFPEMREIAEALLKADTDEKWESLNRRVYGDQQTQGMWHFTGYSYEYMRRHLENTHGLKYVNHAFDGNYNVMITMRKPHR